MPYISQAARARLAAGASPDTEGELNYAICLLALEYIRIKGLSYATLNDVMGALTGALHEIQRRVVDPYEDTKREANGDVFGGED